MAQKKKHRDTISRIFLYYRYYQRTGIIDFFLQNLLKVIISISAIVGLLLLLNAIFDIQTLLEKFVYSLRPAFVYFVFYLSESILGWIPPDIFILWTKDKNSPILLITLLATISYLGGITAYWLGIALQKFPRIQNYIQQRFANNFAQIKKWGGVIIVMSALFPLPFATISTIAGIVRYPFNKFLLYGLTRYLRFYIYAFSIFAALNKIMG
ncbi:MAG: hypothetical protein KAI79_14985 [Bacteroidales bacterium]|nr:hypothetical protein [Bacteroidales bacterium]